MAAHTAFSIAALNKVRKFSLEDRILRIRSCCIEYPKIPSWIIADANFGMMKRDVEIAQTIRNLERYKSNWVKTYINVGK